MILRRSCHRITCALILRDLVLRCCILVAMALHANPLLAAQPNVVLFFVDDMGWTDWQASEAHPNGSPVYETPNMLALAGSGVTFSNAYASAPVCSPTRASLMTGKNPARTRVTDWIGSGNTSGNKVRSPNDWTKNLDSSEVTLAEAFQAAGYDTAFFGKWHLGQNENPNTTPLAHGYNSNVGGTFAGNPGFAGGFFAGTDGAWAGMPGLDSPGTYPANKYLSDALAEKATEYITQSQQGAASNPFFLTMSHYLVHTPLQAPGDLVTKYTERINSLQTDGIDLKGHDNATYAAMVEKMDQSLGMLMQRLEDPNADGSTADSIRDNTIILFTSDHGGLDTSPNSATDNAPLREGKGSLYEGGTRVPMLASWTGNSSIGRGIVTTARTASHDIYPTLQDLTNVSGDATQNSQMDGVSIRAALEGQAFERGYQYWHYPHASPQDSGSDFVNGGSFVSSVMKGQWKLIYFYDDPRYELYDLSNDQSETQSALLANPAIANELSGALHSYLNSVNAQMPISIATGQPVDAPPTLAINTDAPTFRDLFLVDHDFKAADVTGSRWDGAINVDAASQFSANATGEVLTLSSNTKFVGSAFDSPFLYKSIIGDFQATMEIESMDSLNYNVAALVAADPAQIDQDFVWIGQQDRNGTNSDFAQSRSIEAGARLPEQNSSGSFRFYRLIRDGSTFRGLVSNDGALWEEYASYNRPDLPAEILVGLTQGTFSSSVGTVNIASFSVNLESPGDFNGDGAVDFSDLALWQQNHGAMSNANQSDGDADLDNDIDGADFLRLQRDLSQSISSELQTVPEPLGSTSLLALICSSLLLRI